MAETWKKDAFEILDYDSELLYSYLEINDQSYLYRKKETVFFSKTYKEDNEKLLDILFDENLNFELKLNKFEFDDIGLIKTRNSAWFALAKNKIEDKLNLNRYELREGDIIRIGRIWLRVKLIKFQKKENNIEITETSNYFNKLITSPSSNINRSYASPNIRYSMNNNNNNNNISINTDFNFQEIQVNSPIYREKSNLKLSNKNIKNNKISLEDKKEQFCRICYGEEDDEENPLVQPCICQGSMKYIHLNCLKHWLKTNTYVLFDSNEYSKSFKYKEAECELCKTKLPDIIRHKGKSYEIIEFGNDFKNYIIFESLTEDKHKNKYLYKVSLDNNNLLNIGRGHDVNLLIPDASISRNHCAIKILNKKIFLEDCGSKYGTLILIHQEIIKLVEELNLFLQIGRSFIRFTVKKPFSLFGCCTVSETRNFDYYYRQNKIINKDFLKKKIKTDADFDDNEEEENENNKKINDAINKEKTNKEEEEENLFNKVDLCSPVKLNVISECVEENNNEGNNSVNINDNRIEIYEQRGNN